MLDVIHTKEGVGKRGVKEGGLGKRGYGRGV